jgi:capsular exopolysaccharide synthesis family protein
MSLPFAPFSDGAAGPRTVLVDYLRIVYRRRWLALTVFALVVLAAALYVYRTTPVYEARVSVLIDYDEPNVVNFQRVLSELPAYGAYIQTQQELLVSRALVQKTVAAIQLWKRPELGGSSEDAAINIVRGNLRILPVRNTRMVHIAMRSSNPTLAAEIANAHARQYVEESLSRRFRATEEASEWLDSQLKEERQRVQQTESALQAFRERYDDAVSLEEGQNIVVQKLSDLNAAVTKAKTTRIEAEAQYRGITAAQKDPGALDAFPAILASPFIQQLKGDLAKLQRDYAQASETLGDRHPKMVEMRTAMQKTETTLNAEITRVVESIRSTYQKARAEEDTLTEALEAQKREALGLNRRGIEYSALQREAESARLIYNTLLQRAKETGVARELRSTNISIVDRAEVPNVPVAPRTTYIMVMSILTGGLLAVGSVFLSEMLDDRLKVPDDVGNELGQRLLGLVPTVKSGNTAMALAQHSAPRVMMEAFRVIRTSVVAALQGKTPKSVLICSAMQREGKSSIASKLAITLAQAQHRVLLIDADMRRPMAHEILNSRLAPGLSTVLSGSCALTDAIQPTAVRGLNLLAAGNPSREAPELLGSPVFDRLLKILEEHFDWVIIDSPPALTVTDASIIAQRATSVVFVVASARTSVRAARLAIDELQRVGGRVLGIVMNRADVSHQPLDFAPYVSADYLTSLDKAGAPVSSSPATTSNVGQRGA